MRTADIRHGEVARCRLFRVCWLSPVTREGGASAPMSRAQAEFLARDEAIADQFHRFWVEPVGEAAPRRRPGRRRDPFRMPEA